MSVVGKIEDQSHRKLHRPDEHVIRRVRASNTLVFTRNSPPKAYSLLLFQRHFIAVLLSSYLEFLLEQIARDLIPEIDIRVILASEQTLSSQRAIYIYNIVV